ncbi:MAG: aminotransferase class I/II-fold pyridoxal phosphate-dependent enzyme, partial [Thermoplasmatota archaeon]
MNDRSMPLSRRIRMTLPPIMQVMKRMGGSAEHDLTQGVPFFAPPEEALEKTFDGVSALNRYGPDGGDPELKEEVSRKLKRENGMERDPLTEIMITSGANCAFVNAAAAVCDPGDDVLLLSPYYFNHFMTLDMLGAKQRICPMGEGLLPDVENVESYIGPRTKAVVVVSPNNPAGVSYPGELMEDLVELCREKGIWLISDETYDRFVYGTDHTSPGSIGDEPPVISLYSFSKVFGMSGWRV